MDPINVALAVPLLDRHLSRLRAQFPEDAVAFVHTEDLDDILGVADVALTWSFTADQLSRAPRLKWLSLGGAGVEHAPLQDLSIRGIHVTNNSGVHATNIAEHIMGMMLAFARRFPTLLRFQQDRRWDSELIHRQVFELHGQEVLLIGFGEIGQAVAVRTAAFGMRITAVRRRANQLIPTAVNEIGTLGDLPRLLRTADHVVISLPHTVATDGLFSDDIMRHIKQGAFFYNVGRGRVVDTDALIAALQQGRLAGAGLDVVEPEPLPVDSPLWSMENVIITAHTAGATPNYWDRGVNLFEQNLRRFLEGRPLLNLVDPHHGY